MRYYIGTFVLLSWASVLRAAPILDDCDVSKLKLGPQDSYAPVQVLTSTTTYSSKTPITVTLQAKPGEEIADFRLMARSSKYGSQEWSSRGLGTFLSSDPTVVLCGKNGVISKRNTTPRSSVTVTWIAPAKFIHSAPDVKFWAVFNQQHEANWVPFESKVIHYKQDACVDESSCFRYPEGCADNACDVIVGWQLDNDYVTFTASGLILGTERYLAIGFSSTGTMEPSATVNCVRSASTSEVSIHSGHNADRVNTPLSPPTLGLHPTMSGEYVDGWLTCQFSYIKSKALLRSLTQQQTDEDLLADLSANQYYLIAAIGEVDAQDLLQYHGITKVVNPNLVNFTASTSMKMQRERSPPRSLAKKEYNEGIHQKDSVKRDACEVNQNNCFRYPDGCSGRECDVIVGWQLENDYVDFTVSGLLSDDQHYLAIGFSSTGTMAPSATVSCILSQSDFDVKSGVNRERLNRHLSPHSLGLGQSYSWENINGWFTCRFSYVKSPTLLKTLKHRSSDNDLLADLSANKYYLIASKGAVDADGNLQYHGPTSRFINPKLVDFTDTQLMSNDVQTSDEGVAVEKDHVKKSPPATSHQPPATSHQPPATSHQPPATK